MTDEMTPEEEEAWVTEVNAGHDNGFRKFPFHERALFLSHCIRKDIKEEIQRFAEELGYTVHVVGGGSIVHKIIKRDDPRAVVGVACMPELEMAVEKTDRPLCIIRLDSDGCKDTTVNVEKVKKALSVIEE